MVAQRKLEFWQNYDVNCETRAATKNLSHIIFPTFSKACWVRWVTGREDYLPGMPNVMLIKEQSQGCRSCDNTESDKLCKLLELSHEDCIMRVMNVWWLWSVIFAGCFFNHQVRASYQVFFFLLCFEVRGLIKVLQFPSRNHPVPWWRLKGCENTDEK